MVKINLPQKTFKLILIIAIPALIILASYFRVFETFELATLDLRFKLRPPQKITDKVVIVEIAQDTIDALGEWPIKRDYYAAVFDVLTEYNVEAIITDILFGQESPSDEIFIDSVKRSKKVYLPVALRLSDKRQNGIFPQATEYESQPLPALRGYAKGIGHINATTDIDGKRRRVPLFIDIDNKLVPQMSLLAVSDYFNVPLNGIDTQNGRYVRLNSDIRIPIDSSGNTMVNFAGKWGQAFRHYSFVDILRSYAAVQKGKEPVFDLNELSGKICLIGLTAVGTHDLNPIPLQERYPMVGLHANLINTILTKDFIIRAGHPVNIVVLIILSLAVIFALLRLKPFLGILSALGIFFGFIIVAFVLFGFYNIWIDLFYPLLLVFAVYLCCTFYKYIKEQNKRLLMQRELDIAQRIQKSFLREAPPKRERIDIAVIMTAAKSVGGDLYDFIEYEDSSLGIMIGDVSGKGMPAALFMAKTISDFKFHAKTETDPIKIMTGLNNQISTESTSGLFVTMTYLIVDADSRKLTIVDAGHLPVVHAGKGKEATLITATGGMAIGVMDGVEFEQQKIAINPGDIFVLYTDGVTEARNIKKEEFGEDRLRELVSKHKELSASEITDKIYQDILTFRAKAPQHDDITIITIKIN